MFEPASIHSKYGKQAGLPFVDNDEDSIRAYFMDALTRIADPERRVTYSLDLPLVMEGKDSA